MCGSMFAFPSWKSNFISNKQDRPASLPSFLVKAPNLMALEILHFAILLGKLCNGNTRESYLPTKLSTDAPPLKHSVKVSTWYYNED